MKEYTLSPLSLKLRFDFLKVQSIDLNQKTVVSFFEALGLKIADQKNAIIGHIKGFATVKDGEWFKLNLIAHNRPIQVERSSEYSVDSLSLRVNFMVYGLNCQQIQSIVVTLIQEPQKNWSGLIRIVELGETIHQHQHEHDHKHN